MNPYQSLPPSSFWRSAIAEPDVPNLDELWTPKFAIGQDDPILTAGSCFARHIGRALLEHGMNWRDAELAPPGLTAAERHARHYGEFSFRTGNIYTAACLLQWLSWAYGNSTSPTEVWSEEGRYFDPHRPAIEPEGYASPEAMLAARQETLTAIRNAVAGASCLVFTLGLTEAWQNRADGIVYPVCPGTVRGSFDAARHTLHNFNASEVHRDLSAAVALVRAANPQLRVLLTVSPQPLTATATGSHALTANTYTKSVLRAAAGQLAEELDYVDYFPSYEIITGFPFKGVFFEPNLRTVTPQGVAFVMRHFFRAFAKRPAESRVFTANEGEAREGRRTTRVNGEDFECEDAVLDYYNNPTS